MPVFSPDSDPGLPARLQAHDGLIVACYCAAWCDSCRTYQGSFAALAAQWPQHLFLWIDIEDHPALLGDAEVENFPTILLQNRSGNLFFGPQPPYVAHLDRLIRSRARSGQVTQAGPPALASLMKAAP